MNILSYDLNVPVIESEDAYVWKVKNSTEGNTIISNETQFELGFYGMLF